MAAKLGHFTIKLQVEWHMVPTVKATDSERSDNTVETKSPSCQKGKTSPNLVLQNFELRDTPLSGRKGDELPNQKRNASHLTGDHEKDVRTAGSYCTPAKILEDGRTGAEEKTHR